MSTIATNPQTTTRALRLAASLERRGVLASVAVSGLLGAIGGGLLLATSDHLVHPIAYGLMIAVMVAGSFSAALYWLVRRPGNRLGLLLLALGIATAAVSLQGASEPHLHSIGALADSAWFLLAYYVVFAFPEGRIRSPFGWALMGAILFYYLDRYVLWVLFSPVVYGGAPLAGCNAACPANGLMIADRPTIADGIGGPDISPYVIVEMSAILIFLCYRLLSATRPRRRALLPVYVPALMATVPVLAYYGVLQRVNVTASTLSKVGWVATIGYSTLPWGFLVSVVVSTFFAATALKLIVSHLLERPSASQLRATLADALDDPSLELGFRVARGGGFVDPSGMPLATTPSAGQSSSLITQNGETVAVIMHDTALDTDPELVQAAGRSVVLALESGRLESELQSRTAELRSSRARIVETAERERIRLERDLHDGAQQRLTAIQIKLAHAQELPPGEDLSEQLEEVQEDAAAAVEELRALARGIYPSVLRERGVADALRSLAMTAPIPIKVSDSGLGRCPAPIEGAIYFCSLEAIQNAIKHAGADVSVSVSLGRRPKEIRFTIADNGAGMRTRSPADGVGLTSMRDRIGAVGGQLEVTSEPGRGTRVCGTVPGVASGLHSIEIDGAF